MPADQYQRNLPKVANDLVAKLIRITTEFGKTVYGRVYLYDEQFKTLILKVIDTQIYLDSRDEAAIGMAVYNVNNVKFEGEETGARELSEQEIIDEYLAGEIDPNAEHYQEAYKAFAKVEASELKKK